MFILHSTVHSACLYYTPPYLAWCCGCVCTEPAAPVSSCASYLVNILYCTIDFLLFRGTKSLTSMKYSILPCDVCTEQSIISQLIVAKISYTSNISNVRGIGCKVQPASTFSNLRGVPSFRSTRQTSPVFAAFTR